MPKTPQITGHELIRILERAGFVQVRQRGSHVQLRRVEADGRITTFPVPVHAGKTIKQGTLHGILRKAGIDPQALAELKMMLFLSDKMPALEILIFRNLRNYRLAKI